MCWGGRRGPLVSPPRPRSRPTYPSHHGRVLQQVADQKGDAGHFGLGVCGGGVGESVLACVREAPGGRARARARGRLAAERHNKMCIYLQRADQGRGGAGAQAHDLRWGQHACDGRVCVCEGCVCGKGGSFPPGGPPFFSFFLGPIFFSSPPAPPRPRPTHPAAGPSGR